MKAPALAEARATAERALVEAWNPALASLTVERTTTGQQSHAFGWVNASGVHGLQERYTVTVDGTGIQSLLKSYQVPATYRARNISWGDPVSIVLGLLAVAIGIRYRKRVNLAARWRVVFGVITFATAASFVWVFWSLARVTDYLIVSAGFGLIAAIVWFLGSAAIECLLARTKPGAVSSLTVLASRQFRSSPVALAVLRGTLAGLVVLGIDVVGVWLVTTSAGGRLDSVSIFWVAQALSRGWPVGAFVSLAAMQALELGLLVAFVVGVVERVTAPGWVRAGMATALLTASGIHMGMARVQPYYWMLAVLAADYFVLVVIFRRFDVLTIVVASFTMAFVWGVYPLWVLLQPIGAAWPTTALLIWAAVIAAAVVVAFERKFSRPFTRLAGALE